MDEGVFSSEIPIGGPSDTGMDLDFVDELLLGGCWLETTDGSVDLFHHSSPSISGAFFDPNSFSAPMLESSNCKSQITYHHHQEEDDSQSVALIEHSQSGFSGSLIPHQASELNRMFWIQPQAESSMVHRLVRALGLIRELTWNRDVLVQIWVPVSNREGARVLTTSDQPFTVDPTSSKLAHYRDISVNYQFAAEEDSNSRVRLGLPGRVYVGKVPEWTPDVRFFRADEYPRVNDAERCDVSGTLAVPIFEQGSRECIGVIELVMTTQKTHYRPELETVCRALQAVDLRSSELPSSPFVKEPHSSYLVAIPEILKVMKSACETHGLPLAQTWVPCIQQGKQGCRHSDANLVHCVSTVDNACFAMDPRTKSFQETCSEHHLLKGQGVAGRAFLTNQPCFSADITKLGKTDYPLSHHARMFGLCAAVAIRLRSVNTGTCDFVLEFFLPAGCKDAEQQKNMLTSLSVIIQQVCTSLRVVTDEELRNETAPFPVRNKVIMVPDDPPAVNLREKPLIKAENASSPSSSQEELAGPAIQQQQQQYGHWFREDKSKAAVSELKPEVFSADGEGETEGSLSTLVMSGQKKRAKSDKIITLDALRQHFAGSLKDAAKNLGVCPTTLKRICRQHGIKRWPSRKIKKVGHSLQKLQVVIDSVQGASGAFQIGSFYSNFPQLASQSTPVQGSGPVSASKAGDPPKASACEPEGCNQSVAPAVSKSPSSSFSQSSSSSQCFSSGSQPQLVTCSTSFSEDVLTGENSSESALKRARSEAEIHVNSSQEATNRIFSRCQSHKSHITGHQNVESHPPSLPKSIGQAAHTDAAADAWRVKVTYGEEKIRFRMGKGWGFKELVQEVVRRFDIGDMGGFHLKYLDDDSEWVLLTCDADLEECIDVCRLSQPQTIKLSLQVSHNNSRSYVGSNTV